MFKVGQRVWDVVRGRGVVDAIRSETPYPVLVKFAAGGGDNYTMSGKSHVKHENRSLYPYPVEVVKKVVKEVVKPSINWEAVDARFNYLAVDADGSAYLYRDMPELCLIFSEWVTRSTGSQCTEGLFKVENLGLCDWKESLVDRERR